MGWKRRLGSSLALLHLGCRWQPAPAAAIGSKSSDQVRGGPRINSSSAAFSQSRAVLGSRGGGRTKLGGLPAKQAVLQRPSLRRRHREGHRRGQCLMGVKGLTSYVDQNLRAAAPIEHLREVRTRVPGTGVPGRAVQQQYLEWRMPCNSSNTSIVCIRDASVDKRTLAKPLWARLRVCC